MNGWSRLHGFVCAGFLLMGCAAMQQPGSRSTQKLPTPANTAQPGLSAPLPNLGSPKSTPSPVPSTTPSDSPALEKPTLKGPTLGLPQAKSEPVRGKIAQLPSSPKSTGSTSAARSGAVPDPFSTVSRSSLLDEPRWERLHRSTDRRPIETVQLGTGRERVVVMASLHGDETQSVALVEQLARYANGNASEFRDVSVLFIRCPNPDGMAAKTSYNARSVDLNRNFPASNWKLVPSKHTGDKGGSEVETRAVVRLVSDFRPTRLIHIKDSSTGGFVNHDGGLTDLAQEVARHASLKVVKDLGQATSGSIESYLWTQLDVPSLTLLLPKEAGETSAWEKNRAALVATIRGQSDPFDPTLGGNRTRQPAPSNSPRESSWLPRPKGTASTNLVETTSPAFPVPVPERGYLELPPPPSRKGR